MKKAKILMTLVITIMLVAFSCSVGVKKDMLSGLKIEYNGFTVGESYLVKNEKKTTDTKIKPGEEISLVCADIGGFKTVDGKAFPGASILVIDSKGKTVLDVADLFSQYDSTGVDVALAQEALSIKFMAPTSGSQKGDIYKWKSKIWDKKGKSEINCSLELEVE